MNPNKLMQFPPAWMWLTDEAIPAWVKKTYSPRDAWKDKPFTPEDVRFFFKGIEELSELFTEDRPKGMPAYFLHPRFRSAYLLYFLPLQAAKFLSVFQLFPGAIEAALHHGRKAGVLRVADLGCGPGTASLALLLLLLNHKLKLGETLPPVELHWYDTNRDIMDDGQGLVEQLSNSFPKLRGKVTIHTHVTPWWKSPATLPESLSLTFMGHLLNESTAPQREVDTFWRNLFHRAHGGGTLLIEPAARRPAQILSELRNTFFAAELVEPSATRIWGPCLHAETCPLTTGRDWCHFSVPTQIPGKWFKSFSHSLGSERHWLKLSYLWMTARDYPSPKPHALLRRVISDPLNQGPRPMFLLCEPEAPLRWTYTGKAAPGRGDLVKVAANSGAAPFRVKAKGASENSDAPEGNGNDDDGESYYD
jgi:SAM-dependent methyltransferase